MNKKQYVLLLVVALIAGLVGGAVSSWLFRGTLVFTQKTIQQEKVIQAERFEVVDERGKVQAAFGIGGLDKSVEPVLYILNSDSNTPRFVLSFLGWDFLNSNGTRSVGLRAFRPELTMVDEGGHPRLGLGVNFQGTPHLKFDDKDLTERAELTLSPDGTPRLELRAKDGQTRAKLALVNGGAELGLTSDTNEARLSVEPRPETGSATLDLTSKNPSGQCEHEVSLAAYEYGPSLSISSGTGFDVKKDADPKRAEIELGIGAEGPSVTLKDNDGKERATLGQTALEITRTGSTEKRAASSLVLFDKQGKVIWRAP